MNTQRRIIDEKKVGRYTIKLQQLPWQLMLEPAYFEPRFRVIVQKLDWHGGNTVGTSTVDMTEPVMTLAEGEAAYQRICAEYAVALARSVLAV